MDNEITQKELNEEQKAARMAEIGALESSINTDLKIYEERTVATIDEVMFREVFLPFFANDPVEERKYPTVDMSHWLSISRTVFHPVNIVSREGKVLFQVPPVKDRDAIHLYDPMGEHREETGKEHRLSHVLATASMLKDRSYNTAEQMMTTEISGRVAVAGIRNRIIKHAHQWNEIFHYYGREIPFPDIEKVIESEDLELNKVETKEEVAKKEESSKAPASAGVAGVDYEDELA